MHTYPASPLHQHRNGPIMEESREPLIAVEIEQLARFDEHWRVCLAGDNRLLVVALAKRGYLEVLKRRVPLYRVSALLRK